MGVVPVLSPSEDVRVGDMFAYPFNPDRAVHAARRGRGGALAVIPRWATLDVLEALEAEYQMRPSWPATPDEYLQICENPESRDWAQASDTSGERIFAPDRVPDRLRHYAVPEFSTFTLTDGEVNAMIPTEAINLVFGSAWNDTRAISIRMNSAETYSLGLQKIIDAALGDTAAGLVLKQPYRNHLSLIADPASDRVWVRVLSDVVYVRSIDFILQSQNSFEEDDVVSADEFIAQVDETVTVVEEEILMDDDLGEAEANDEATRDENLEGEGDENIIEVETTITETEQIPDHELDPAFAAFVRADAINRILIEADADDLPGGFLRFISVTDDSLTLRRVWQRGLAVGARGLTLEIDKSSGEVLRSGNMGSLLP